MMTIRTLFFASYRDLAGADELALSLPEPARVSDLVAALRGRGGAWSRLPDAPAVAVNMEYASPSHPLRDGDEVALIPPVGGGSR
jgi:molybdopterin converting factor subunit 1